MRLFEIDDQDRTWAKINGIDLDIDEQYQRTVNILDMLIKLKSPHLTQNWLYTIEQVESNLRTIINTNFANDITTQDIKDNAKIALANIQTLKNKL